MLSSVPGSFRDPANRVYSFSENSEKGQDYGVYRGVNQKSLDYYRELSQAPFFKGLVADRKLVRTKEVDSGNIFKQIKNDGWAGVLEHEPVPFITYPYEWPFEMLKDAAILHLDILEEALEGGWTLKDATPYNIQWLNSRPVFIDIPSFEPWETGSPWVGYRQFCNMFLTPLMLRAHLDIDHLPLLRSYLDGIAPTEALKFFQGKNKFKKGVMAHLSLAARVETSIQKKERDDVEVKARTARTHSKAMVIGLVQSLNRLVKKLKVDIAHTDWSHYDKTHSYNDQEHDEKKGFVEKAIKAAPRKFVWDIGCNTGTFSRIAAAHADLVLGLDGDHDAVQQLYLKEKTEKDSKIISAVMNLANISPNHGWAGQERAALDNRRKPDLVLVLALIHHMRISSNIPTSLFLSWLRGLDAEIVIEFVTRKDEMVVKLLAHKSEQYLDYNVEQFASECEELFQISDRQILKGGKREIFHLIPRR